MGDDIQSADIFFELLGKINLSVELWAIYMCSSDNVIENRTFPRSDTNSSPFQMHN